MPDDHPAARARLRGLATLTSAVLVLAGCQDGASSVDASPWPIAPTGREQIGVCHVPGSSEKPPESELSKGTPRFGEGLPPGVLLDLAGPPEKVYVALGDSYAAGEGAPIPDSCGDDNRTFLSGTAEEGNHCHRSVSAYPVHVWSALERRDPGWTLDFRACSGATSKNFETHQSWDDTFGPFNRHQDRANPPQWAIDPGTGEPEELATSRQADLVTITMTGNDIGFADIVADCVINIYTTKAQRRPPWWIDCGNDRDELIQDQREGVLERLTATFRSAREHLNNGGHVLVTGYPQPFPGGSVLPDGCGVGAGALIQKNEMAWLNYVAEQANSMVREAARDASVTYVSISDILQRGDHTMCEDKAGPDVGERWINRVIPSHKEWSAHPNEYMHAAEAERMLACYDNAANPSGRPYFCHYPDGATQSPPASPDVWPVAVGPLPDDDAAIDQPFERWAHELLGCSHEQGGPGLGASVNDVAFGDVTMDGVEDAVLTVACVPSTSSWSEATLLLDGAEGRSHAPVMFAWGRWDIVTDITEITIPGNGTITFDLEENHSISANAVWDRAGSEVWSWVAAERTAELVRDDLRWTVDASAEPCPVFRVDSTEQFWSVATYALTDQPGTVAVCATTDGAVHYAASTEDGATLLPADVIGESIFEARNGTFTYLVEDYGPDGSRLTVTDGDRLISESALTRII